MRRRQDGPDGVLDIPATITATIRRAGFLRLLYRSSRRPPEYIVLMERQSVSDHFTALIGDLTRLLQADGVHLARYYFDHDPYRSTTKRATTCCWPIWRERRRFIGSWPLVRPAPSCIRCRVACSIGPTGAREVADARDARGG